MFPKAQYLSKIACSKKSNMKKLTCITALMLIAFVFSASAQTKPVSMHKMVAPNNLQWGDAPPGLPKGAKVAVLYGNPGAAGLFTIRMKFPKGYLIPPHWHPTDEYITVMSGAFKMGFGDNFDRSKMQTLTAGGFSVTPMKTSHYAFADEETIVQIQGTGPFEITYVNPMDDPRKKAASSVRR